MIARQVFRSPKPSLSSIPSDLFDSHAKFLQMAHGCDIWTTIMKDPRMELIWGHSVLTNGCSILIPEFVEATATDAGANPPAVFMLC